MAPSTVLLEHGVLSASPHERVNAVLFQQLNVRLCVEALRAQHQRGLLGAEDSSPDHDGRREFLRLDVDAVPPLDPPHDRRVRRRGKSRLVREQDNCPFTEEVVQAEIQTRPILPRRQSRAVSERFVPEVQVVSDPIHRVPTRAEHRRQFGVGDVPVLHRRCVDQPPQNGVVSDVPPPFPRNRNRLFLSDGVFDSRNQLSSQPNIFSALRRPLSFGTA